MIIKDMNAKTKNTQGLGVGKLSEAGKIISDLLDQAPYPHCQEMHHERRDYHKLGEPCPVVARAMKIRERAEAFISADRNR